ncbi:hypothetical protein GOODEAATRI_005587, partial [Goodea atripinnis]
KIPEEAKALSLLAPATPVPSLIPGGGLLPIPTPAPLQNLNLPLVNRITAGLDATASVLAQPPLVGNVDPSKIDEIRRTVYVGNLNSQLLEFFKQVGDVKFVRMAGDETQPTRFAFVEFIEQESVARALTLNGVMFGDRPLKSRSKHRCLESLSLTRYCYCGVQLVIFCFFPAGGADQHQGPGLGATPTVREAVTGGALVPETGDMPGVGPGVLTAASFTSLNSVQ